MLNSPFLEFVIDCKYYINHIYITDMLPVVHLFNFKYNTVLLEFSPYFLIDLHTLIQINIFY